MKALFAVLCSAVVLTAAEDPLTVARNLYAAAAYEEALSTLDGVDTGDRSEQIDQYRVFCLFALGRTAEATSAVDALIARNPLFAPNADASPRIVALFSSARQRLLPALIRQRYLLARDHLDRRDFGNAITEFETVRQMLDELAKIGPAEDTTQDLGVVVDGFLDLLRLSTASKAAAPAEPLRDVAVPAAPSSVPPVIEPALGAPAPALPIFTAESDGIVPPVPIRQDLPRFPHHLIWSLKDGLQGVVEVVIDTQGNVERVRLREPIHPAYDRLVLTSAKKWTYQAAQKDQRPVRFMKTVRVVVNRDAVVSR